MRQVRGPHPSHVIQSFLSLLRLLWEEYTEILVTVVVVNKESD